MWSEYPEDFKIVFCGESPGREENEAGKPFVGDAGRYLNHVFHDAGILRHRVGIMNILPCQPPGNSMDSEEAQEALACCKPGLDAELKMVFSKAKVFVPLGNVPARYLGIQENITRARGSVYERGKTLLIPTFHPSYILRGQRKEESTWIGDFIKIKDIAEKGWKPPKEDFNLFPTLSDLEAFSREAVKSKALIAVDLETTGLSADSGLIIVAGLAISGEQALSVPFLKQGGHQYWAPAEFNRMKKLLQDIFSSCELLFQYGTGVDLPFLMKNGFKIDRTPHDTMFAHAVIHPELPHNLGYIASVFGATPYWKEQMRQRSSRMLDLPDQDVRLYNLRDAAVLQQVYPGLLSDLDEFGLRSVYEEITRKMILPVLEMQLTGIGLDKKALEAYRRKIQTRRTKLSNQIHADFSLPPAFNLSSDEDLRLLVYGAVPNKCRKAEEALLLYETNPKLRKDTKKYAEIQERLLLSRLSPLYQPRAKTRLTGSGKVSVKEEHLLARKISMFARLDEISALKRKDASDEKALILRSLSFLSLLGQYNECDKLFSTYTRFPVWSDGRVHSSYNIAGTVTGRLSSSAPNAQNIPEDARHVFVARTGHQILGPDYTNLEVWVIAFESGDQRLQEALLSGANIHDENCRDLFGLDKTDSLWKEGRDAGKIWMFGGQSYGGTLRGIYEKVLIKAPNLKLSFGAFSAADARLKKKYPQLAAWKEKQKKTGLEERIVFNAFGRRRILLGEDRDVEKEALNTPIQGTAADVANKALISFWEEKERLGLSAKLIGQVHDALLVEAPKNEAAQVKRLLKKAMEQEHFLWNRKVSFKIELKSGLNWGALK